MYTMAQRRVYRLRTTIEKGAKEMVSLDFHRNVSSIGTHSEPLIQLFRDTSTISRDSHYFCLGL
jgi:hypothetical protein